MASHEHTQTRLAELETKAERCEVLFNVLQREIQISNERMDEVKEQQRMLLNAVFGDMTDPQARPGIIPRLAQIEHRQDVHAEKVKVEFTRMEEKVTDTNNILNEMRGDIRRLVWIIVGSVVAALMTLILKH